MSGKSLLKAGFLFVWFGATIGNLLLIFFIVTLTAGSSPEKALYQIISKSITGDFVALAVLGMMVLFAIVSVILIMTLYGSYVRQINSLSGRKIYIIGFVASLIFYLLIFMRACHWAGVCI